MYLCVACFTLWNIQSEYLQCGNNRKIITLWKWMCNSRRFQPLERVRFQTGFKCDIPLNSSECVGHRAK